jgi:hypothetical protein
MHYSTKISGPLVLSLAFSAAAILVSPTPCLADSLGIIVPAYFYPGTGGPGGSGDGWAAMASAASEVPITAIFNPDSGPLPGPADPNYVTAMTNLETAGGHVDAYVYTNYGATSLSTVEGELNTYITQYGSLIDGFFLDGMSTVPSEVSYYQTLDSYIKGLSSSYTVIGNPGTLTPSGYSSTANTLNVFEGSSASFSGLSPADHSSSQYSYIIYGAATTSAMTADINEALGFNAGDVYVTDQPLNPPTGYLYDQLPSYWDQEVAAIAAANAASVPEPGKGAMVILCGLALVTMAVKRRRNLAVRP